MRYSFKNTDMNAIVNVINYVNFFGISFIRILKNSFSFLLLFLFFIVTITSFTSCHQDVSLSKKVLVILSYDSLHVQYQDFIHQIQQTINENGYEVDIRAIYADTEYDPENIAANLKMESDRLSIDGWMPHVIITEDDRTARLLLSSKENIFDIDHTPLVLGGIRFPEMLYNTNDRKNVCVWYAPIDYYENIRLACMLTGSNHVLIELDDYIQDRIIRAQLTNSISRPPFVNNLEGSLIYFNDNLLETTYSDSIVVTSFGVAGTSYDISHPNPTIVLHREQVRSFLKMSNKYPSIVVKKDLYCDAIANKSNRPQFTAINTDFDDGMGSYLGGYFAGYPTIAHDCANSAIQIFQGINPANISGQTHQSQFWLDYDAMTKVGMDYNKYSTAFHIVGAPFTVTHPTLHTLLILTIILVAIAFAMAIIYLLKKLRDRAQARSMLRIGNSRNISRLCLNSVENMPINSVDDIRKYLSTLHPQHLDEAKPILDSLNHVGNYSFMLFCAPKTDNQYQWWQCRYDVNSSDIIGILINKQEEKDFKERIQYAKQSAKEADRKDNFINNLSSQIRTPLDAVCNCCDQLINSVLSSQQRQLIVQQLRDNSTILSQEISDILLFSQIESGRMRYEISEKSVEPFITDFFQSSQSLIPPRLQYQLTEGRPFIFVSADFSCLHNVLTQFLLNAIKNTPSGNISIGWRYYLESQECEFFVSDTGIGLSVSQQEKLFDLFKNEDEGIKLGLNICRSLAEAMNGRINVNSMKGYGSRFSIWLPARAVPQEQQS